MAAHKLTKKEIKQDSFITNMEKALEFLQRNATAVGAVLLIIVVLLVGGSYVQKGREASRVEASYMLYQGQMMLAQGEYEIAITPLQDCIDKYSGSEFGKFARVSLVQALLGAGETETALARLDEFMAEIPATHAAGQDLRSIQASAYADAGRFAEAADFQAALITDDLPDAVFYSRSVRRAEWLTKAGNNAAALAIYTDLESALAAGDLTVSGNDLANRMEVARALMQ